MVATLFPLSLKIYKGTYENLGVASIFHYILEKFIACSLTFLCKDQKLSLGESLSIRFGEKCDSHGASLDLFNVSVNLFLHRKLGIELSKNHPLGCVFDNRLDPSAVKTHYLNGSRVSIVYFRKSILPVYCLLLLGGTAGYCYIC